MKKKIESEQAPKPIGPYSQAVVKNNVLYASGQIAINPATGELVTESLEKETKLVLRNVDAVLESSGFSKDDVVKVSIFLKNMDDFSKINEWYSEFFSRVEVYPARETVEVSKLPRNVNVEISFIAVK